MRRWVRSFQTCVRSNGPTLRQHRESGVERTVTEQIRLSHRGPRPDAAIGRVTDHLNRHALVGLHGYSPLPSLGTVGIEALDRRILLAQPRHHASARILILKTGRHDGDSQAMGRNFGASRRNDNRISADRPRDVFHELGQ